MIIHARLTIVGGSAEATVLPCRQISGKSIHVMDLRDASNCGNVRSLALQASSSPLSAFLNSVFGRIVCTAGVWQILSRRYGAVGCSLNTVVVFKDSTMSRKR